MALDTAAGMVGGELSVELNQNAASEALKMLEGGMGKRRLGGVWRWGRKNL